MQPLTLLIAQQWADKIPSDKAALLYQQLEKVPDNKLNYLALVPIKNPVVGLILGVFLGHFGADRFYKGDIGLGILKCLSWFGGFILSWIFIIAGVSTHSDSAFITGLVLAVLAILAPAIWVMVDWFFVWKGIKRDNFSKITQHLHTLESSTQESHALKSNILESSTPSSSV